jgi:hypothetical protein
MVEESQKKKKQSEANLYVVPFCRYNLNESMPLAMMKRLDEEVPPVFMILDTFDKDVKSLLPSTHLFCIYGDNWFQSVKYTLRCLVATNPSSDCVRRIKDTERKLSDKKHHLETFQVLFLHKFASPWCNLRPLVQGLDELNHFFEESLLIVLFLDYLMNSQLQRQRCSRLERC